MDRISLRTCLAQLNYYSVDLKSLSTLSCRSCRSQLDLHQPDPNQPDQFLGTCPECGAWYRVDATGEDGRVTVMQLPEVGEIKEPSAAKKPKP